MLSAQVVIVEDERIVALHLKQQLTRLGYTVAGVATSASQALEVIAGTAPDVVLMDIRIDGDRDGIDTAGQIRDIPVIYLTAYAEDATLERARATMPFGYLVKPVSERELHATIQMALKRREVEADLHQSREFLTLALDAADMGTWRMDPSDGRIERDSNACRISGVPDEAASVFLADFLDEIVDEDRQGVARSIEMLTEQGIPCDIRFRREFPDSAVRWLRGRGKVYRVDQFEKRQIVGVVQDINTAIEIENRRQLAARMETLGKLAGGIAHDIGNLLGPILTLPELMLSQMVAEDPRRRHLEMILNSGERIRSLVGQILAFGRNTNASSQVIDLAKTVGDTVNFLRGILPAGVTVREDIAADTGNVEALSIQVDAILINLMVNAADAITGEDGTIDVVLERTKVGRRMAERIGLPKGTYARLTVADNGRGLDPATMKRIFEPFFTTKAPGEGTGLGLSVVFDMVSRLGGAINVKSDVGVGSLFEVHLPLASD